MTSETHNIGTSKRMDPMRAQEVTTKLRSASPMPSALLVTSKPNDTIGALKADGIEVRAIQPNVYRLFAEGLNVWLADISGVQPLTTGGYIIIPSASGFVDEATFSLGGILFRTTSVDYVLIACEE